VKKKRKNKKNPIWSQNIRKQNKKKKSKNKKNISRFTPDQIVLGNEVEAHLFSINTTEKGGKLFFFLPVVKERDEWVKSLMDCMQVYLFGKKEDEGKAKKIEFLGY
jgi:hypothetical protein